MLAPGRRAELQPAKPHTTPAAASASRGANYNRYGKVTLNVDCLNRGTRARFTALPMHAPTGVPLNGPEATLALLTRPVLPLNTTLTVAVPPASFRHALTAPLTP